MVFRTRLPKRTVWNFTAGLLTGLMMLYLIASNERCLYVDENDVGKSNRSVDAHATSIRRSTVALKTSQHHQRVLHNDLKDGRIPAKGTFLSLLNVKIVSIVIERIKHHNACYIKTKKKTISQTTDQ